LDGVQQKDVADVEALLGLCPGTILRHNIKNASHAYDLICLHSAVNQCDLVPLNKGERLGDEFSDGHQISLLHFAGFWLGLPGGCPVD